MTMHRANRPLPIFDGPLLFAFFKDFLISFNISLMHKGLKRKECKMKKTVLSARNLCKSFAHNGGQLHILTQVNLDLYEGDFTVEATAFDKSGAVDISMLNECFDRLRKRRAEL